MGNSQTIAQKVFLSETLGTNTLFRDETVCPPGLSFSRLRECFGIPLSLVDGPLDQDLATDCTDFSSFLKPLPSRTDVPSVVAARTVCSFVSFVVNY
jgi:hypothetical protein